MNKVDFDVLDIHRQAKGQLSIPIPDQFLLGRINHELIVSVPVNKYATFNLLVLVKAVGNGFRILQGKADVSTALDSSLLKSFGRLFPPGFFPNDVACIFLPLTRAPPYAIDKDFFFLPCILQGNPSSRMDRSM